jgi:hypothetical protein
MEKHEFKPGDRVAIFRHGAIIGLDTVKRVMARFVELERGSKWSHGGDHYPRQPFCTHHIAPATTEHIEAFKHRELADALASSVKWYALSIDQLQRISQIITEAKH